MITKIRNYIFTGLLITLPLVISTIITIWLFRVVTNWILYLLPHELLINPYIRTIMRFLIPVALVFLLAFVGLTARVVFIRKFFSIGERILVKIPLFNKIYVAIKQISISLMPSEKNIFNRVVLVEFPRKGIYAIGFITSRDKNEVHEKLHEDIVNVFVPTTPNPTSGFLLFLPKDGFIPLDMSIEDGLKLVISGGAVNPVHITKNK